MASPGTSSSHAALVNAALESARAKCPLSEHIGAMKTILYSDGAAAAAARPGDSLTQAVLATELLAELIVNLPDLEFECRKDVTMVFSNLLRRQSAEKAHSTSPLGLATAPRLARSYQDGCPTPSPDATP